MDLELVRLHVRVVLRQDIALHFRQRPCDLDARRTATDDRYREEGFAGLGLVGDECLLDVLQEDVAQIHRLVEGLHRETMLGDLLIAKVVRRTTACQDEVVVGYFAHRGDELLLLRLDADDVRQAEDEVLLALEGSTEGESDGAGL